MVALYAEHPQALRSLHAGIAGAVSAGLPVFAGTAGSLATRSNQLGYAYYAHRYYDGSGTQREVYLAGPVGDAVADAAAAELGARIAEVKALLPDIRLLKREGYQSVDTKTYATLAALQRQGLFAAGAVLVGSHAYGVLLNQLGVRAVAYATEDIDIARREALAFSTVPEISFVEMLRKSGIAFVEVPQLDVRKPSTSFKQQGMSRFHVDLLVPSPDENFPQIAVPELQAHATGLPYLAYLLGADQMAPLLGSEGACQVRVPLPERYALHKLLVSQLRAERGLKSRNDTVQATVLLAALAEREPGALSAAAEVLPVSAHRHVALALKGLREKLANEAPRVLEELAESPLAEGSGAEK